MKKLYVAGVVVCFIIPILGIISIESHRNALNKDIVEFDKRMVRTLDSILKQRQIRRLDTRKLND